MKQQQQKDLQQKEAYPPIAHPSCYLHVPSDLFLVYSKGIDSNLLLVCYASFCYMANAVTEKYQKPTFQINTNLDYHGNKTKQERKKRKGVLHTFLIKQLLESHLFLSIFKLLALYHDLLGKCLLLTFKKFLYQLSIVT